RADRRTGPVGADRPPRRDPGAGADRRLQKRAPAARDPGFGRRPVSLPARGLSRGVAAGLSRPSGRVRTPMDRGTAADGDRLRASRPAPALTPLFALP